MTQPAGNSYPVELSPPDLRTYRHVGSGPEYVVSYDSEKPGPHVMLMALVHGNEICGAIALDRLLRRGIRPSRGRLTFAFANIAAYEQFDRRYPEATRYVDEDFNRLWSQEKLEAQIDTVERRRARELRPLIDTVDLLLDLHSMQHPSAPLALSGPLQKGKDLAIAVGAPEVVVVDSGHASGSRLRDYGWFTDADRPANALLVECGQHWAAESAAVAVDVSYRFLAHADILPDEFIPLEARASRPPQRVIEVTDRVTVQSDHFRFTESFLGLEEIPKAGEIIGFDGPTPIRTPYANAVLVMPSRRLVKGQTAVRIGRAIEAQSA